MERWVLEGDSYSFLRSAPQTFNLQNREGANRVEIFDITAIPSHHNAISETTCLCDIFGDDNESMSLSSSPASSTFVRKEAEQPFPAEDANDSSGSYHTANGSDLSDTTEATYNTPSPKDLQDFSTQEANKPHSPSPKSTISDTKNGHDIFDCSPPVNSDDLSKTDYCEEPQSSENEMEKANPSESLPPPTSNFNKSSNKPAHPSSCSPEEKDSVDFKQEGHISQHETMTELTDSALLAEKQLELNNVLSFESLEYINSHCPREENVLLAPHSIHGNSVFELLSSSPEEISPIPTTEQDTEFLSTSTSLDSKVISSTSASKSRSSNLLTNACSMPEQNTLDSPEIGESHCKSMLSTNNEVVEDSLTAFVNSTEQREPVFSFLDDEEISEKLGIKETCSSPNQSVPSISPEPVIVSSLVGYNLSHSPTTIDIISQHEGQFPETPSFDDCEISSTSDHLEPVTIDNYTICGAPMKEGGVYSTETMSPSSTNERGINSISQSPMKERGIYSTESISPSLTKEGGVYSTQPISLSPTKEGGVYSTEPMSPSPTNERGINSTESMSPSPTKEGVFSTESMSTSPTKEGVFSTESMSTSPTKERGIYSIESISPSLTKEGGVNSTVPISSSPTKEGGIYSTDPIDQSLTKERSVLTAESMSPSIKFEGKVYSTEPMRLSPVKEGGVYSTEPINSSPTIERRVYSPYTMTPSPANEKGVYSTDSMSPSPTKMYSTESMINSITNEGVYLTEQMSQSPTNERGGYFTDPEASTSSLCCDSIYSPSDCSVSVHSPEPGISHSPMEYTMSPLSTNERMLYSVETQDLSSSPALAESDYTAMLPCSRESTPSLRSILSTPYSRQSYLSPEAISPAPSLELRSITCSPEIKTISYSILSHAIESPGIRGAPHNLSPNKIVQPAVVDYSSETSNSIFENDVSLSPSLRNVLLTPDGQSRLSSDASEHMSEEALFYDQQPEPSMLLEKAETQLLTKSSEGINNPSHNPIGSDYVDHLPDRDSIIACDPDEYTGSKTEVCFQTQILNTSPTNLSSSGLSALVEKYQEFETDHTKDLTICRSLNPWESPVPVSVKSEEKQQGNMNIFDHKNETELLEMNSASNDLVSSEFVKNPGIIFRDGSNECDGKQSRVKEESGWEGVGEETIGESSYRGEQVELSFSTRNRKGPGNHSTALSSRDLKSGIPTRCYFESPPTTLQQQSPLRDRGSRQDSKSGASRLKSNAQGKYNRTGFRPPLFSGENFSMGSELDEADNEVKWFTDLALRSLTSPQADYLDVYNSSHRSSTNASQPSTLDSPGAVAWMAYADLRGSALHDNDGTALLKRDGLEHNRHFEMGNFECVDVALESKEDFNKRKRTVPKRQIQLLRRNTDETKEKETSEKNPISPSMHRRTSEPIVRQHSTPVFVEEEISKHVTDSPQNERKRTIQKSLSLDDGSPKTQRASCIIKSILSRKMQDTQEDTPKSADQGTAGDHTKHNHSSSDCVPGITERFSSSSSQHSESTLASEEIVAKEERVSLHLAKKCAPKVPPKPSFRPLFLNSDESLKADTIVKEKSRHVVDFAPSDYKIPMKYNSKADSKEGDGDNLEKKCNSDTTNASVRNMNPVPTISMQSKDTKKQMALENDDQLDEKSVFMSRTLEMTLKPSATKGKNTSSLQVMSISPDPEHCSMEKTDENSTKYNKVNEKEDTEEDKKAVLHKVRDVRKLVKNTYNLSFKASNVTSMPEETVIQEKTENPQQTSPALQIECKAISWKDKQTTSKPIHWHDEKQPANKSKISQPWVAAETRRDPDITDITSKDFHRQEAEPEQKVPYSQSPSKIELPTSEIVTMKPFTKSDEPPKIDSRSPIEERQVSALKVFPNATSKAKTLEPTIPDSSQLKGVINSHSVSLLLKEKGMQADIGVCDVLTDGGSVGTKHVNKLEVPVQACLSEGISTEAHANVIDTAAPCNQSTSAKNCSRPSTQIESPVTSQGLSTNGQTEKKITSNTTMTQLPSYLAISDKSEVRSFASNSKTNAIPNISSKEIELPIQVRSVSNDRRKQFVSTKPNYKQSFGEIKSVACDPRKADKHVSSVIKPQPRLSNEPTMNEPLLTLMQKEQSNEAQLRDPKILPVSAISSYKPSSTSSSTVQKSTTIRVASPDLQKTSVPLQTTKSLQQTQAFSLDQSILSNSLGSKAPGNKQAVTRVSSNNHLHSDDYVFYASDDPPSYDERERFSPLKLSDLPSQRLCSYHPATKQTPCSCPPSSHLHQGNSLQGHFERLPVSSHSSSQVVSCPGAPPQAQVRPRQCRPDGLPVSNTLPHASALIQPLHKPRAHPTSNTQPYGDDQPETAKLYVDRHPANHPSPQAAALTSYQEYTHLSNIPALDPRPQLYNPQDLPPSFGHDFANEGPGAAGVFYQENPSGLSCGQNPRRVLLDPETGKYFYIEVPMQPLRKMLFDPELGQYVEVLIPQQTMSHSGMYPPAAPPYSSLHSPGLYAPQYLPYAMPSYPGIPGSAQQGRHPEAQPIAPTLQQASLRYGSPGGQMTKNDPKGHTSLDQNYLENMYFIHSGMNASPKSTTSDCYHKPSVSMPPPGGRRA